MQSYFVQAHGGKKTKKEKTGELMRSLTFDPTLFPVSAEIQLLITLLQSLVVLSLYY